MKPDKRDDKIPTQGDLEKLPLKTFSKSMRPLEDIMASYIAKGELTDSEERLLDRVMFEKTGQHIGRFRDPKPSKPVDRGLDILDNKGFKTKAEARSAGKKNNPKAPENVS